MGRRPAAPAENCPKRIGQTTGTGLGHWNLGLPVLLATVLLGTPLLAASPAEAADGWRNGLPPPGRLDYVVTRGGTDIGRNTVEFLRDGDGLVVRTRMDIEVDFMSITLYRLHHKGEEHWKDGRLFAYTSRTDDDGTEITVTLK